MSPVTDVKVLVVVKIVMGWVIGLIIVHAVVLQMSSILLCSTVRTMPFKLKVDVVL
jgi:uncharacterized membrane protein